jgi:hypothetical protein
MSTGSALLDVLLGAMGFLITGIAGWFVFEFREMRKSVEELNVKIATVIAKVEDHAGRIERLEERN